jgi:hypothetical protein
MAKEKRNLSNDYDTDPHPITAEEVANYAKEWRRITQCPEGKSFTQHLEDLMDKLRKGA